MNEGVTLVVSTGVYGDSEPEMMLNDALEANTLDILEMARKVKGIEKRVLMTNSKKLINAASSSNLNMTVKETSESFHFGRSLFEVIEGYDIRDLFYIGGGSGALLKRDDLERVASFLTESSNVLLANNFYSTDMIGLSPAKKILTSDPPEKDNGLGWLARDAGLTPHEMSRNARTQMDLDSPVDLIPLKLSGKATGKLGRFLSSLDEDRTRIEEVLPQFTNQKCRLVIAGRIGANTWSAVEGNAACHSDVLSEDRGDYTQTGKDGSEYLWLGRLFEDLGPREFIRFLANKGTGVFLDTRVLFDCMDEWPSREDRFSADLLEEESIGLDCLEQLASYARESPEPIVLGGHSIVSGSLYLLSSTAWQLTEPDSVNILPEKFEMDDLD